MSRRWADGNEYSGARKFVWVVITVSGRTQNGVTRTKKQTKAIAFDAEKLLAICRADHEFEYTLVRRAAMSTANRMKANRRMLADLLTQADN
jgi:hypothetical protein